MKTIRCVLLAVVTGGLFSCGATDEIPVGSSLSAFPSEVSWAIGPSESCDVENGPFNDSHISLSLVDGDLGPLIDTNVSVTLDLSEASFSGTEVLSLFHDANSDGIYTPDERVSGNGEPVFSARTDDDSGVLRVMVRVNLSCSYSGSLFAFAGRAVTAVQFDVESVE